MPEGLDTIVGERGIMPLGAETTGGFGQSLVPQRRSDFTGRCAQCGGSRKRITAGQNPRPNLKETVESPLILSYPIAFCIQICAKDHCLDDGHVVAEGTHGQLRLNLVHIGMPGRHSGRTHESKAPPMKAKEQGLSL